MPKKPLSTQLSVGLLAELRSCVVSLSGPPERLTISGLVERAVRQEVVRLRKKRNAGRPFSKPGSPRPGARVKIR